MLKYLSILIFLFFSIGCRDENHTEVDYRSGTVEKTSKEFLIPRKLREHIENQYLAFIRKENPKVVLPDAEVLARIPREFLSVKLFFSADGPGVLKDNTEFNLPRGGGEIDLKEVVIGKKGSFFLKYRLERTADPKADLKDVHIYFLSEIKKRKIDGEDFGAGCNVFMDITEQMKLANDEKGLRLNATEQRYLPVVGGVFYFVDFNPERKMYIAAVRVKDTRYPAQSCEEIDQ